MRVCDKCGKKLGFGSCKVTFIQTTFPYMHKTFELCSKCTNGVTKSITKFGDGQEGE